MAVAEAAKQQKLDTMKVLVADDDPPTRMLLRSAIGQWGYEVVEASDGEEAWSILQKPDAPRLMICDWLMPKLDGITLCARIKEQSASHPYIILLTQVTGTTNIVKGLEAGADEFLSKPFNMAELRSRLSVGARIKKYESSLARLQQIAELTTSLTKKINDYFTANPNAAGSQSIQEIKSDLENLNNGLKNINLNQKQEGK